MRGSRKVAVPLLLEPILTKSHAFSASWCDQFGAERQLSGQVVGELVYCRSQLLNEEAKVKRQSLTKEKLCSYLKSKEANMPRNCEIWPGRTLPEPRELERGGEGSRCTLVSLWSLKVRLTLAILLYIGRYMRAFY